jgi:hypothetical protein
MVMNFMHHNDNENFDTMSMRSQKSRVTFSEEIELDSLEPEINNIFAKSEMLGTIREYETGSSSSDCGCQMITDDFDDEHLNEFHEFDVSF